MPITQRCCCSHKRVPSRRTSLTAFGNHHRLLTSRFTGDDTKDLTTSCTCVHKDNAILTAHTTTLLLNLRCSKVAIFKVIKKWNTMSTKITLRKIPFGVDQSKNLFISTFRSDATVKELLDRANDQVNRAIQSRYICLNYAWARNEVIPENTLVSDIELAPGEILFLTSRKTPPTAELIQAAQDSCEFKLSEVEPVKMALPQETVKTVAPKRRAKKHVGKSKRRAKTLPPKALKEDEI